MKLYEQKQTDIVRIKFGSGESLSFTDATVDQVFDVAMRVFSDMVVNKTVETTPLTKPGSPVKVILLVRDESKYKKGEGYKVKSKSKTVYGLSPKQAKDYFLENYKFFQY
jgi:hypothetical protein